MDKEIAEILGYTLLFVGAYVVKSVFGFYMKLSKEKNEKVWRDMQQESLKSWREGQKEWANQIKSEVIEILQGTKEQIALLNDKFDNLSDNLHEEMRIQDKKMTLLEERIEEEKASRQRFEKKISGELAKTRKSLQSAIENISAKSRSVDPPPPDDLNRPPQHPRN